MAYWVTPCGDVSCVAALVAQVAAEHCEDGSALERFANSGVIEANTAAEANRLCEGKRKEQVDVDLLYAYIAARGSRGPVPGWDRR